MSWAGDRLGYLSQRYSYSEIREITGVPESTISYVIRGERKLPGQYFLNVRSMYSRTVYAELRASGATPDVAARFRGRSVARTVAYIQESQSVATQLAMTRFSQYNETLKRMGQYISDQDTMERLKKAITLSMGKSPKGSGEDYHKNTPSLRHLIEEEEI